MIAPREFVKSAILLSFFQGMLAGKIGNTVNMLELLPGN
jgi:hypothetical protein